MNKSHPEKGFMSQCKDCIRKYSLNKRNENPTRARKYKREWYKNYQNKLSVKKYNKEYDLQNPGKKRKITKRFTDAHPNNLKKYAEKRNNKNHKISKEEWETCKEYFNNSCAYCGISELLAKETQGQRLHKEHVIYNGANDLSNCVPSCRSCNSQKWEFELTEWYNINNINYSQDRFDKINSWLNSDYKKYIKSTEG
jgi:hypothetical protein